MEKVSVNAQEFNGFFGIDEATVIDSDIAIVEENEQDVETSTEDSPTQFAQLEDDVLLVEDEESSEELTEEAEEETPETVSPLQLYRATATAFGQKFGFEFNEEAITDIDSFGEFADAFGDYITEAKIESYKNQTEELKTLIELAEKGGSLKELSKIYEQRQQVVEADITTEDGQIAIIKQYYKDENKKSPEWINRFVNGLKADGELETEALEVKEQLQEKYTKEAQLKAAQETKIAQEKEQKKISKIKGFGDALVKKGIPQKSAASAVDYVYKEAYKAPDGTLLSAFDMWVINLKNNPDELIEAVQFAVNKEKYIQSKLASATTVKTENTFNTILKNQVNKKGASADVPPVKSTKQLPTLSMGEFIKSKAN